MPRSLFCLLVLASTIFSPSCHRPRRVPISPPRHLYPIRGIDVSHHQQEIDWEQVAAWDLTFVYMKATEGTTFTDPRFEVNWREAQVAGFDVGAYHFYSFCKGGAAQAQHFIKTVPRSAEALPPVIDLEYYGNCELTLSKADILAEINTMQRLLTAHYGVKPVLYVGRQFYKDYLRNSFLDHELWIPNLSREPLLDDERDWTLWQYTHTGLINGIGTAVDFNVFAGDSLAYEGFRMINAVE